MASNTIRIEIGLDTKKADADLRGFSGRFKSAIDANTASIQGLRNAVAGLGSVFAAIGAANILKDIATRALDAAKEIDKMRSTLTALTGSATAAQKRLTELFALAQKTPGLTTSLAATLDTQLRILNVTEKTINRLLPVIGKLNAISPLGNPAQFVNNLTQLITQNFERQDLKELVGQSPLAGNLIKQIFNVDSPTNAEAIRAAAKRLGVNTVERLAEELIKAAETSQALKDAVETIAGRFDKLGDRLNVALEPVGSEIAKILLPLFEELVKAAETYGQVAAEVFRENRDDIITMAKALAQATIETGRFLARINELGQSIGLWGSLRDSIQEVALMAATASDLLSGDFSGSRTRKLAQQFSLDRSGREGSPFLSGPVRTIPGLTTPAGGGVRIPGAGAAGGGTRRPRLSVLPLTADDLVTSQFEGEAEMRAESAARARSRDIRRALTLELTQKEDAAFVAERLRQGRLSRAAVTFDFEEREKAAKEAEKQLKALQKTGELLSANERFMRGFERATLSLGDAFERFGENVAQAFLNVRDLFAGLKRAVLDFFNDLIGSTLQNLVRGTLGGIFGGIGGGFGNIFRTGPTFPASVSGGGTRSVAGAIGGSGGLLGGIFGGGGGAAAGGGFSLSGLTGALGGAAPFLGVGLGAGLGGSSTLGKIFGGIGGGLIGTVAGVGLLGGSGPILALATNPFTLPIAAALLVGSVFLGKAAQRRKDEAASGQFLTQALQGIEALKAAIQSDQVDGASARGIFESQILGTFIQQINTLKTESVRKSRLTNQVSDLRKVYEASVTPAIAAQAARRGTSASNALNFSRQVPEFATGGTTMGGLAFLHPGEKILNLKQQAAVRSMAGQTVFERAGVPGVQQNPIFEGGGTFRGGEPIEINFDIVLGMSKSGAQEITVTGLSSNRGRRVIVGQINTARTNREL